MYIWSHYNTFLFIIHGIIIQIKSLLYINRYSVVVPIIIFASLTQYFSAGQTKTDPLSNPNSLNYPAVHRAFQLTFNVLQQHSIFKKFTARSFKANDDLYCLKYLTVSRNRQSGTITELKISSERF